MTPDRAARRAELHAVLRPRRARYVAWTLLVVQAVVLVGLALVLPWDGPVAYAWYDRASIAGVAVVVGALLFRLATVRVEPREDGVRVRNLLRSRDLAWPQIVSVRLGGGDPWVTLDLSDGDSCVAMGIQRTDGPQGQEQANRLATLVALHSRTEHDA